GGATCHFVNREKIVSKRDLADLLAVRLDGAPLLHPIKSLLEVEGRHAKTVLYCSLETPCAASQSHTAVYSGGGVAPRSVNSWRCFDNSFISVVRSSATYLKSALRFNSSSAST